jgi:hypothetical protein
MLNPSLDVDTWINISYSTAPKNSSDEDLIDDDVAEAFFKALKNSTKNSKSSEFFINRSLLPILLLVALKSNWCT